MIQYAFWLQLDEKPPVTINHIYTRTKHGAVFMTKQAKNYKSYITFSLQSKYKNHYEGLNQTLIAPNTMIQELAIILSLKHEDFYTKAHEFKKWDISNLIKVLEDSFIDFLNLRYPEKYYDDSNILKVSIEKRLVENHGDERSLQYYILDDEV